VAEGALENISIFWQATFLSGLHFCIQAVFVLCCICFLLYYYYSLARPSWSLVSTVVKLKVHVVQNMLMRQSDVQAVYSSTMGLLLCICCKNACRFFDIQFEFLPLNRIFL
jgi:hypothetical protein